MIYKIRAILDVTEDVFRDILIDGATSLEDLHKTLANSFDFNGQEMASFFRTDNEWNQGDEIPLINMSDDLNKPEMRDLKIQDELKSVNDKLIYVYDFFSMWAFFIEVKEIKENSENIELPKIALAFGVVPEEAPEKEFKADKSQHDPFTSSIPGIDEFDDELGNFDAENFENIDDIDPDKI
ncbi:plasmid pRiA4b ORF-3 family protein [Aureivirga marina]|uniref:plasmid pRiA4b ORF-3 family protein n=1 Tax=Aureivirga marina TaxID=1182451 RepID=UPI001E386B2F|nr:plasmid pRiA4b ORF-3 family protein [Aureivirga marina]